MVCLYPMQMWLSGSEMETERKWGIERSLVRVTLKFTTCKRLVDVAEHWSLMNRAVNRILQSPTVTCKINLSLLLTVPRQTEKCCWFRKLYIRTICHWIWKLLLTLFSVTFVVCLSTLEVIKSENALHTESWEQTWLMWLYCSGTGCVGLTHSANQIKVTRSLPHQRGVGSVGSEVDAF